MAGNDADLINLAHSDNDDEEEKQCKDKVDVKGGMLEEQGVEEEKGGDHSSTERKASVSEMISKIERGGVSDKKEKERVERDLNSTTLEEKEKEEALSTAKKPRPPVPKATKPRVVSHDEDAGTAAAKDTQSSKDTKDTDNVGVKPFISRDPSNAQNSMMISYNATSIEVVYLMYCTV